MKRLLIPLTCLLAVLCFQPRANAVEPSTSRGTFVGGTHLTLWPGIGLDMTGDYVLVDDCWIGHFAVGAYLGANYNKIEYNNYENMQESHLSILPRVTYGINFTDLFEAHTGLFLGPTFRDYSYVVRTSDNLGPATTGISNHENDTQASFGILLGGRYWFLDNLALAGEFLYDVTYGITAGVGIAFEF
ncbi:MAG: hypothetical protein IJ154_06030 [Bacteroidales bacterium]|nr:hypothetical protein [Bacteroidales bacterium]